MHWDGMKWLTMQLRGPHTVEIDGVEYPVTLAHGLCAYHPRDALKAVYVISTGDKAPAITKVGIATDVARRLVDLQASSPVKLKLFYAFDVPAQAAEWVERSAHDTLRCAHTHHEWFKCTPLQASAAIKLALAHMSAVEHFYQSREIRYSREWREVSDWFPSERLRPNPHLAPTLDGLIRKERMQKAKSSTARDPSR